MTSSIRRRAVVAVTVGAYTAVAGCRAGGDDMETTSGTDQAKPGAEWPVVGGDVYGTRYSVLDEINRGNVGDLQEAWRYRAGEEPRLEGTPIMLDGTLFFATPFGRVIALDPATGEERWRFDRQIDRKEGFGAWANRGVTAWADPAADERTPCARRIFVAAVDARLAALDAGDGQPCSEFGQNGIVDLREGLRAAPFKTAAYAVTSPPVVLGDLVVTGSAVADNSRLAPASGEVRAFDARTGELRWSWDPIPQNPDDPAYTSWEEGSAHRTGAANVWTTMVVDPVRGLIFAPTSSPAPDHFGGRRRGDNRYANSIVALRAETGEVAWSFQTVHHDLWDYDNPSPPALVEVDRAGAQIPAVLLATKTGQLFVLDIETGEPLFDVEERPVPASDLPGEAASPTQPFTAQIAPLSLHSFASQDVWGITPEDRDACREMVAGLRNEGIFTPPSLKGTVVIPSSWGGAHWGGLAFDPERQLAVLPVNRVAEMVQLIPAEGFDLARAEAESDRLRLGYDYTVMLGTPYAMRRRLLLAPSGIPCTPPPFGELVAVDLKSGRIAWRSPLGVPKPSSTSQARLAPGSGSRNFGGPIVTAGGLVFIAATLDHAFRAFDVETGVELWQTELPAWGRATPMTYEADGRQYVVIAAGGSETFGEANYIIAYNLR
jgi:quinoprotein glucose dehydrogenase